MTVINGRDAYGRPVFVTMQKDRIIDILESKILHTLSLLHEETREYNKAYAAGVKFALYHIVKENMKKGPDDVLNHHQMRELLEYINTFSKDTDLEES